MERELSLLIKIRDLASKGVEQFNKELKNTDANAKKAGGAMRAFGAAASFVTSGLGKAVRAILSLRTAFLGFLAAIGTRAIVNFVEQLDRLGKTAQTLGILPDTFSELGHAAQFAGASSADMERALGKLNLAIGQARSGSIEFQTVFRQLGIEMVGIDGKLKATDTILFDVSNALSGIGSQAEKARLAARLFGEEAGPKLLNLLGSGREGLFVMMAEVRRFGATVSEELTQSAAGFMDALARLTLAIRGIINGILAKILPDLTAIMNAIANVIAFSREAVVGGFVAIYEAVRGGLEVLASIAFTFGYDLATNQTPRVFELLRLAVRLGIETIVQEIVAALVKMSGAINSAFGAGLFAVFADELLVFRAGVETAFGSGSQNTLQQFTAKLAEITNDPAWRDFMQTVGNFSGTGGLPTITGTTGGDPRGEGGQKNFADRFTESLQRLSTQIKSSKSLMDNFFSSMTLVGGQAVLGLSQGFSAWSERIMDVTARMSELVTGALGTMQQTAAGLIEDMIRGTKSAGDALRAFGQAFINTLINMAAQLLVIIPLAILFNVLTGGALSLSGLATTSAALSGGAGLIGAYATTQSAGGGGGGGGQQLSGPTTSQSNVAGGGATYVQITAVDSQSFDDAINRNRASITKVTADSLRNDVNMRRAARTV